MSVYPSDQRCPRCRYPVAAGALVCSNCGQTLTSTPSAPGNPYGGSAYPGGSSNYGGTPSTSYGDPAINNAPTVQTPLYPQGPSGWTPPQPQPPSYIPPPPSYPSAQGASGYNASPVYPTTPPVSAYPGSQPQGGFTVPPTYPGNQPPAGFPTPPIMPGPQPTQEKSNGPMIAIITVVVLVVLIGGGIAAFLLIRPKPALTITSHYMNGSTPVGATNTSLHVIGQNFSSDSTITFLLDGQPAPDTQTVLSDSNGGVDIELKISKEWAVGQHRMTARDSNNNVTQAETPIQIVNPGEGTTPGPNGSPSNSVSFTLSMTITSPGVGTAHETLIITGKGDKGGTVCESRDDGKTPYTVSGTLTFGDGNQVPYSETSTNSCSGTYVGGHLTYTETTITDVWDFSGSKCNGAPHKGEIIDGTFTDGKTLNGTFAADSFELDCKYKDQYISINADKGTFTATLNE